MELSTWDFQSNNMANVHKLGHQFCPVCAQRMQACDVLKQDEVFYIWYRCTRLGCDGAYLEKFIKAGNAV